MIKAIILDKDGTLIELGRTWDQPSIDATNDLLEQSTLNEEEKEAFRKHMGIEGDSIVPNSIYASGSIEDQAKEFVKILDKTTTEIEEYLENTFLNFVQGQSERVQLMDGVVNALEALKDKYILAVVTNDNQRIAQETLKLVNIDHYFEFVAGADDFGPKPNPAALHEIARQFDIRLDEMVYVGDSKVDMEYGKHTRASIGLAIEEEHLSHLKEADYIIKHFDELVETLDTINGLVTK